MPIPTGLRNDAAPAVGSSETAAQPVTARLSAPMAIAKAKDIRMGLSEAGGRRASWNRW